MAKPLPKPPSRLYAWYVLALLALVYVANMADRQIVGILAEDIKRDLHLTDGQLGILTGPAIGFFYSVLGIPMAYAADRVNRIRFISICLAIWSAMTILGGRATSLMQLAATRIGVSIAEAGSTPSSASIIADYFPPRRRGTAMAIWTAATALGVFVGFALGGVVNQSIGWRNTFVVAGVPGVVLALLLLATVREPIRGSADETPHDASAGLQMSMAATCRYLWKIALFRQAILAAAGCNFCVFGVLAWAAPFAVRSYGVGTAEAGTGIGIAIAVSGCSAMIVSGILTDRLGRRGLARPLIFVAVMVALSAALFAAAFHAPDFRSFGLFFALAYAALMVNPPIGWVILQETSPPEMRAMAAAIMLFVYNILSSVPAPLIIGYASDALHPGFGAQSLGMALSVIPVVGLLSSFQFLRTARTARRLDAAPQAARPSDYVHATS